LAAQYLKRPITHSPPTFPVQGFYREMPRVFPSPSSVASTRNWPTPNPDSISMPNSFTFSPLSAVSSHTGLPSFSDATAEPGASQQHRSACKSHPEDEEDEVPSVASFRRESESLDRLALLRIAKMCAHTLLLMLLLQCYSLASYDVRSLVFLAPLLSVFFGYVLSPDDLAVATSASYLPTSPSHSASTKEEHSPALTHSTDDIPGWLNIFIWIFSVFLPLNTFGALLNGKKDSHASKEDDEIYLYSNEPVTPSKEDDKVISWDQNEQKEDKALPSKPNKPVRNALDWPAEISLVEDGQTSNQLESPVFDEVPEGPKIEQDAEFGVASNHRSASSGETMTKIEHRQGDRKVKNAETRKKESAREDCNTEEPFTAFFTSSTNDSERVTPELNVTYVYRSCWQDVVNVIWDEVQCRISS